MRKKILKAVEVFCLFTVVCVSIIGCAGKESEQSDPPDVHMTNESDSNDETSEKNGSDEAEDNIEEIDNSSEESNDEVGNSSEAEKGSNGKGTFYDGANLSGRVVDFTDTGFIITPRTLIVNEDGSMEGGIAAPGYESDETNINITYAEDVVFQIINFSMGSQTETSRADTDKSSIKKDTDVNIFGTCQDEKHWIADKVVITRWQ